MGHTDYIDGYYDNEPELPRDKYNRLHRLLIRKEEKRQKEILESKKVKTVEEIEDYNKLVSDAK